jgi:hypothetical protein
MPDMASLLAAVAELVRAVVRDLLEPDGGDAEQVALEQVRRRREPCERAASRRTGDWMSYTAVLVQVDRVVDDLRGPPSPG